MQTHYVITLYFPLHFALFFDQAFHWPMAMGSLSFFDAVYAEETLYEYAILFCCTAVKCTTAAGALKTIQNPRTSSFIFLLRLLSLRRFSFIDRGYLNVFFHRG